MPPTKIWVKNKIKKATNHPIKITNYRGNIQLCQATALHLTTPSKKITMKSVIAIFTLFLGSVEAFAPYAATGARTSIAISASSFEQELGSQPPLGFWDPLNLVYQQDQERFDRLRYVEIKHGRISMLAILGHITTTAGIHLPGNIDKAGTAFSSIPTGIKGLSQIPNEGLLQMVAFIGFLEVFVMKDVTGSGEFGGDFRNKVDFGGWDRFSEEEKMNKRAIELNQGRAAQMGILAMMVHEKIGGDPYIINALVGHPTV